MYGDTSVYDTEASYVPAEEAAPPFGAGIGGEVGGELSIDGTPLRLSSFVVVAVIVLVLYHTGKYRFHVTI